MTDKVAMFEEMAALREMLTSAQQEAEMLKRMLTPEAQCATFLASGPGKALLARIGDLSKLHDAVCALLSAPSETAPGALAEALRQRLASAKS